MKPWAPRSISIRSISFVVSRCSNAGPTWGRLGSDNSTPSIITRVLYPSSPRIRRAVGFPKPPFLGIDLSKHFDFYAFTIFISIFVFFLLRQFIESPFGYGLRMIRDNAERPAALGFNNQNHKPVSYTHLTLPTKA